MSKYWLSFALLLVASAPHGGAKAEPGAARGAPSAVTSNADVETRRALQRRLANDRSFALAAVDVQVKSGIVLLTGAVPVVAASRRAARLARVIEGVRGVVNRIRIEPVRRPDAQVAREVRQALRRIPALARMPIAVAVTRGVVLLRGSITSWDEQQLAESVVAAVPGVRFCQNQLTLARSMSRTPAVVAADIRTRLSRDPYVEAAPIRVEVRGGEVVLSGSVAWPAQRTRALRHAWVPGVTGVNADGLRIDSTLPGQEGLRRAWPNDADIMAAIADLLPYWPRLAAAVPSSVVVGGVVTLRGNVPTLADRDAAQVMVSSAVGVVEVRDELRGPWWRPPPAPPPAPVRAKPPARRKSSKRTR